MTLCLNPTSPDAILHINAAGLTTYANRTARAIFGYEKDELISQPIATLANKTSAKDGRRQSVARQFTGFGLAAGVAGALAKSGLSPDKLELEITESVFLTDSEENIRLLKKLKGLGVRIALDYSGTGYSSLAYLCQFSFDKLRIDRSFVTDVTASAENLAIVRAVIRLGKSFSAVVAAECVEAEEQRECLHAEGRDQFQGYLFSWLIGERAINAMLCSISYQNTSAPTRLSGT